MTKRLKFYAIYIYAVLHLTWLTSPHYFVKRTCSTKISSLQQTV